MEALGLIMNTPTVTWLKPAPCCVIPALHPARAHVPSVKTDVAETWKLHDIGDIRDDYQMVQDDDWMSAPGGFK